MKITHRGEPISTGALRSIGFQCIDLAGSVERFHAQEAQARHRPTITKEAREAANAKARAETSLAKLKALLNGEEL